MEIKIKPLPTFQREAKRLKKHYASFVDDYAELLEQIHKNPAAGIDLGGGLRQKEKAKAAEPESSHLQ